jgi:hypothetical protein
MKKTIITVYFGESNGMFGSSYNTISLEPMDIEETVDAFINGQQWIKVNTLTGAKYINTNNVLWFETKEVDEELIKQPDIPPEYSNPLENLFPNMLKKENT